MKTKKTPSKKPATKGQKPRRLAPVPGYAFYCRPVRQVDGSYTVMIETSKSYKPETRPMIYWKYRRGGYNPADGSYGRCATKEDAQRILDRHNDKAEAPSLSEVDPPAAGSHSVVSFRGLTPPKINRTKSENSICIIRTMCEYEG